MLNINISFGRIVERFEKAKTSMGNAFQNKCKILSLEAKRGGDK